MNVKFDSDGVFWSVCKVIDVFQRYMIFYVIVIIPASIEL